MFELFKLRVGHMFTKSRKLAKQIQRIEAQAPEMEKGIQEQIAHIRTAYATRGEPEHIILEFKRLAESLKEYFDKVVFTEEEDAELYILREEQDIENLYKGLTEVFNEIKTALPDDQEEAQKLIALINKTREEGMTFKKKLQEDFRKVRDQRREHEHYRDKVFTLRKDFQERHAIKELRRDANPHKHLEHEEEEDIKELEKHLKAIEKLKKNGEGMEKDKKKIRGLIKDLAADLTKDFSLLEETIKDMSLIIDYAVFKFFNAMDLEESCKQLLAGITRLWRIHRQEVEKIINEELDEWMKRREDIEYRIIKKIKKETKKGARQEDRVTQ